MELAYLKYQFLLNDINMMNLMYLLIIAVIYSQIINVVESLIWTRGIWKLKPPFFTTPPNKVKGSYHFWLMIFYVLPFLFMTSNIIHIVACAWLVWLLNDITWHIWSVYPKYWIDWILFYFNPKDDRVVWYARLKFRIVAVTPKRMFRITLIRLILLKIFLIMAFSF